MVRDEKSGMADHTPVGEGARRYKRQCTGRRNSKEGRDERNNPRKLHKNPKSLVLRQLEEESLQKWQRSWTQTTKGGTTKEYFPDIEGRIKMKLNHTGNLTTILTGHGNIKAHLKRFQISDDLTCPCGIGEQTTIT